MLWIKAFIYRLTGIFLAHAEQQKYLSSSEGRQLITVLCLDLDLDESGAVELATGLWQAKHGFTRPLQR